MKGDFSDHFATFNVGLTMKKREKEEKDKRKCNNFHTMISVCYC